jgi:hypothetical protein
MARSYISDVTDDLIQDSGNVLWSFVKGEQLEYPITLNFLEDVTAGYTYEAVVIEALNVANTTDKPVAIQPGGVQTVLGIRLPVSRGLWQDIQAYNQEEVVIYGNAVYRLRSGAARVSAITPNLDPFWELTTLNKLYLQFPKTLGAGWAVAPAVGATVYGFFELRVTEPDYSIFQRTWKPVRGMVQILFSPTEVVPDA